MSVFRQAQASPSSDGLSGCFSTLAVLPYRSSSSDALGAVPLDTVPGLRSFVRTCACGGYIMRPPICTKGQKDELQHSFVLILDPDGENAQPILVNIGHIVIARMLPNRLTLCLTDNQELTMTGAASQELIATLIRRSIMTNGHVVPKSAIPWLKCESFM